MLEALLRVDQVLWSLKNIHYGPVHAHKVLRYRRRFMLYAVYAIGSRTSPFR
jgi:hypothetical protein